MKVLIIEDEKPAAENLMFLLKDIDPTIEVETVIDSVSEAVAYFDKGTEVELVFMDIHLADGVSFEIFEKAQVKQPVIFTTAYDAYALKAFKVNSVDYLLKPIDSEELQNALKRHQDRVHGAPTAHQFQEVFRLLQKEKVNYRNSYLVQQRDTLIPLNVVDLAYFTIVSGIVKAVTHDNRSFILDRKMEDIEAELDSNLFFRVNRQFIVQRKAIENLKLYFNGKLILNLKPKPEEQVVISKLKAPLLKKWIN